MAVETTVLNIATWLVKSVVGDSCDPIGRSIRNKLCDPIAKSVCNMYHFKSNVENLKSKEKELELKKRGVEDRAKKARSQGKLITGEVTKWLHDANAVAVRLANITKEGNLAWYPRYSDSREAAKLVVEVDELLEKLFGNAKDYHFASRKSVFDDVMETLNKGDAKVIGLHGMGGVGKTTLVKQVYVQLTEVERLFDQVVMVEVSQSQNPRERIQQAIANQLGLEFPGEEDAGARAPRLRERFEKEKSILVILDDVWEDPHLEDLGIPFGDANDRRCRILVTSRYQDVCTTMKSEKNISVEPLSDDEAWILFWETMDDDGAIQSQFECTARSIVKKIGGLPIAILAIAKTLKLSDSFFWNKVSKELGNFKCSAVVSDFHPVLKQTYDYWKNEEAKLLFLLFGLHEVGHPILIDHLVRCVIGLGFLHSVTTMKAARDEVDQLIKELKNANLLLDSDRKDEVKLHDVFRVVAQKIASEECNMFNIQDVVYLDDELEKPMYKDSKAISLHPRQVSTLPENPDLPNLQLLLLHLPRASYDLQFPDLPNFKIPDHFFDRMIELRVLALHGVCLHSFISLLNYRTKLRTLSLEYCHLENIMMVGKLTNLEVLSFSGSNVERLPEEIGDLTRLKLLDLEHCSELIEIPPNVISKLMRLEELYVSSSFANWDTPKNASLTELKLLGCLTVLNIHIREDQTISRDCFPPNLERFKIFGLAISRTLENIQGGCHEDLKSFFDNKVSFPRLKNLTLSSLDLPNIWCNQLGSFGKKLTSLDVFNCRHLKFLFSSSTVNGLQQLEELKVANCESMEVIINKEGSSGEKVCDSLEELSDVPEGSSSKSVIIFPKLAHLTLSGLRKLKSFYHGLHVSEWPSLKELTVKECDKVEEIFGSKFQGLCEEKQSVPQPLFIVNEDAFPRLEKLELQRNDNVKEIWHGGGKISKTLLFRGKTNIIEFPHYLLPTDTLEASSGYFKQIGGGSDNTFAATLCKLRALIVRDDDDDDDEEEEEEEEEDDDDDDDDDSLHESFESSDSLACLVSSWVSFQNLTNLQVTHSRNGFRHLLTYSTATSLQHLTRLEISNCEKLEAIIMPPTNEVNDKIVFSQLKYLKFKKLGSLASFYSGSHTLEFPSLEEMIVIACPNMKVFSEGDSITPVLQSIQLEQDDNVEWRWEGDLNSTIQKDVQRDDRFDRRMRGYNPNFSNSRTSPQQSTVHAASKKSVSADLPSPSTSVSIPEEP